METYSNNIEIIIQQITSTTKKPLGITGIPNEESITKVISFGVSLINLDFDENTCQNIQEQLQRMKSLLNQIEKEEKPIADWKKFHEKILKDKLSQISPTQVCEVYNKPIYCDKIYPLLRFTKICGKAYTIKVWAGDYKSVIKLLLQAPEDSIVVIDAGGTGSAVWGALATEIAIKKKIQATVIYGAITDINYIRNKNLPCYISAINSMTSEQGGTALCNIPIQIGNVTIHPDDWIFGDDNGVICLPAWDAFSVVEQCLQQSSKTRNMLQEIAENNDIESIALSFLNLS